MTTYYVSPSGSDANNGLGPDASHATNKPWLTLKTALGTGSPMLPGDTLWVAPGIHYQGATTSPLATVTSSASPTAVRGDPTNSQGFKDGSGVRLAPAPSVITIRTGTSELDAYPSVTGVNLILGQTNGPNGLQWYNLVFENDPLSAACFTMTVTSGNCENWLFEDCRFQGNTGIQLISGIATPNRNLTVRRCIFMCQNMALQATITANASTADADLNILFESCLFLGRPAGGLGLGPAGGTLSGGIRWKGCTALVLSNNTQQGLGTLAGRVSTVTPLRVERCILFAAVPLSAGDVGAIVDDGYCRFNAPTSALSNVTAHATTVGGFMPNFVLPDLVKWGVELPRADMFGWTDQAATSQRFSGASATGELGWWGRTARPWGGGPSIGYVEALDVAQDTTSAITGGGTTSIKLTGAGEISFFVKVPAQATTLSITTKSTSYGGTNWPQLIVEPNPSIGVTRQTGTATSASEQAVSAGPFTPTAAGVVEVRLVSRSSSTTSTTYFDLLTAS